ncbi:unnamed protein product [Dibothriocephalus latus]|uniref:Trichoplein keratin filament-binding protein n=1 Tax=Dibothriocephalus latus TaxID=60516 RepID=A0A3P6V1Q7_DIBLA|nr:unnamed protein product [Dibothriocephalus latus]
MWPTVKTKNIYEAIMLKKRAAEENRQAQEKITQKYYKAAEIRANKEKYWTSDTSFKHSILAYLQPKKEDILERLESRRNKLRTLLREENNAFDVMLCEIYSLKRILNGYPEESDVATENMKQEYYRLAGEREAERSEAQAQDALDNMAFEEERADNRMQEDAVEKQQRQQKKEKDRRHVEFLHEQVQELKQREQEVNELNSEREHLLAEKVRISELEEERQAIEEERRRQSQGKALLRQHATALRRRARQVQGDIETDIQWLSKVVQQQSLNQAHAQDAAERLRSEGTAMLSMLEDDLQRERNREAQMVDLDSQEAAEVWKKRNEQWMQEQNARTRLLNELQAQKLAENECMQKLVKETRLSDEVHQETTRERQQQQTDELEDQRSERQQNNKTADKEALTKSELEHKVEEAYAAALRAEAERLQVSDSFTPSKGRGQSFYDHRRKTYLW